MFIKIWISVSRPREQKEPQNVMMSAALNLWFENKKTADGVSPAAL